MATFYMTKNELLGLIAAVCLALLILFLQPTLVGGTASSSSAALGANKRDTTHCNSKGQLNTTDNSCICYSGYYGHQVRVYVLSLSSRLVQYNTYLYSRYIWPYYHRIYQCNLKYCPFGPSWSSFPVANQSKYMPLVECSDMGICDSTQG